MKLQRHEFIPGPMGGGVRAQDDGEWVEFEDVRAILCEVHSVLSELDNLANVWGDEGVFRRCRDRLRTLVSPSQMQQMIDNS